MRLEILQAEYEKVVLDLSRAELGDLAVMIDELAPIGAALKMLLERELEAVLSDKLPLRLIRLVKPNEIGGLLQRKQLVGIIGVVVAE